MNTPKLFMDSGAFSARGVGAVISLDAYCGFLKQHEELFEVYACLDVIGDPVATHAQQLRMEEKGLKPLPCFHYGEDPKYLVKYLERYDYIAIGGATTAGSTEQLIMWLDNLWEQYLTDYDGLPVVRVHGFAMTAVDVMRRYPWYSVDSTSWLLSAGLGKVVFCIDDEYGQPTLVGLEMSDKSPALEIAGKHFGNMPAAYRLKVKALAEKLNLDLAKLSTDYTERFLSNAHAYMEFARRLPYRTFSTGQHSLFGAPTKHRVRGTAAPWGAMQMYLAGNLPGKKQLTKRLMQEFGYNRLLSYHYLNKGSDWKEAQEVLCCA